MKFNELNTKRKHTPNRVGRGIAAGQGKTAGRGTKGYGARTGSKARPGFVGGQTPLMVALPKLPGFRSHKPKMECVFTDQLTGLGVKAVNNEVFAKAGLVSSAYTNVKLLTRGEIDTAVTIEIQGASRSAIAAVEKAGGTVKIVPRTGRPTLKLDSKKADT